jgi:hypothetical protein
MRLFFSIVTGYLMFVVASTLLFQFSGRDPSAAPDAAFAAISIVLGMCFAFVGGFWASKCAKRRSIVAAACVGGIIAATALASLIFEARGASRWSQLAALCLMAPSAVLGGWLHRQRQPS